MSRISKCSFYLAYILFIILRAINNSMLQFRVYEFTTLIVHWVIIALLVIGFVLKGRFAKNHLCFSAVLSVVSIFVYFCNPNVDFLCVILFIILSPIVDSDCILKCSIIVNSIVLFFIILLCKIGILEDLMYRHVSVLGVSSAHSYGFVYYSTAPFMVYFISCMILNYWRNKYVYIALSVLNILTYTVFTAILPLASYTLMLLISLLVYNTDLLERVKGWVVSLPFIFGLFSIATCLLYTSDSLILSTINKILNTRLSQGKEGLLRYGISLFGKPVEMHGTYKVTYAWVEGMKNFFIDNDYIYILIAYGIVFYIVVITLFSRILSTFISQNENSLIIWAISTVIFGFVNSALLSVDINPILLVGVNRLFLWSKSNEFKIEKEYQCISSKR